MAGEGAFEDATTFKTDYPAHPLQFKPHQKGNLYMKPEGDIDLRTSYINDYPEKSVGKTASMRPVNNYNDDGVPFEGFPTYKHDYLPWKANKQETIKKDKTYAPPTAPMDDRTTFRMDFIPRDLPKTKSCKPDNMTLVSKEPFDDLTNNKIDYRSHPLPERVWIPKAEYAPPKAPLESTTTNQRDFQGHAARKLDSFKPRNDGIKSEQPLDDKTEFRDSYKQWEMPIKDKKAGNVYVKPQGVMDDTTSHKKDYVPHPHQVTRAFKPTNQGSGNDAQFDDTTTFKTDYKPWQASNERRGDPSRKAYEMPKVPFDGIPTYAAHYIQKDANPVRSYKPDNFIEANRAPFEGNTMYKTEYTMKQVEPCPVLDLPKHGYRFLETRPTGCQVYAK